MIGLLSFVNELVVNISTSIKKRWLNLMFPSS